MPDPRSHTRRPVPGPFAVTALAALLTASCTAFPAAAQSTRYTLDTLRVQVASRLQGGAVGRLVTVVSARELRRMPVTSVTQALQWILGADVRERSPASADLELRGASYNQVLVLVNGVRMNDPQTGHFDLDLAVPLERVQRIEVLLGPASALFGADAVGGVVNIVTKRPERGAQMRVQTGSFGTDAVGGSVADRWGGWGAAVGADYTRSKGYRSDTDYRILQVQSGGDGRVGGGSLDWSLGEGLRDFGASDFYGPYPAYEKTQTTTGSTTWTTSTAGGVSVTPQLTYRRHVDDFFLERNDPGFYHNHHVSTQAGGNIVTRVPLSTASSLALGGEWVRESLASNNLGYRHQDRQGLFGELGWDPGALETRLGLRVDWRQGLAPFVSPSASVALRLGSRVRLRAEGGRAFRTPTWTERFYTDPANRGTPDLKPERTWAGGLGVDVALPWGVLGRATVFTRHTQDLIDWVKPTADASAVWTAENVASATFRGLEATLSGFRAGPVRLGARASWLTVAADEPPGLTSKYALRPVVRTVALDATGHLPAGLLLVGEVRERMRRGESGVVLMDARLSVPTPFGDVFADGTNLTNASYLDVSGRPTEGRAFSVGIRAALGGDR